MINDDASGMVAGASGVSDYGHSVYYRIPPIATFLVHWFSIVHTFQRSDKNEVLETFRF